jgi:lysozyme family protein
MANFELWIAKVKKHEGGYVNDPDDMGGETYCGITRKNWPTWAGWVIIDQSKPLKTGDIVTACDEAVNMFYKKHYWDEVRADEIESQEAADSIADFAVNVGVVPSMKMAQKALGMEKPHGIMDDTTLGLLNDLGDNFKIA